MGILPLTHLKYSKILRCIFLTVYPIVKFFQPFTSVAEPLWNTLYILSISQNTAAVLVTCESHIWSYEMWDLNVKCTKALSREIMLSHYTHLGDNSTSGTSTPWKPGHF